MKKTFKILIGIVLLIAAGGYIYWQNNKNKILKNSIDNVLKIKTDSLYYIHYDSSVVDEINGNASFYNVVLQSDSAQKILLNRTDSLPNALYNINIKKVMANGVDMAGLLQTQYLSANKIELIKPVIQIINTGANQPKVYTINDTLELYKKILGKFKSIKAATIQITNGTVLITNKSGKAQTTLENINVTINQFLIDSTKDYTSIISYFIKDVTATIENIQLPVAKNNTRINLEKVVYNANQRKLQVNAIKQYKVGDMNAIIDLKNIQINDLNTDAFIIQQRLKAGLITCDGGVVTIYVKKKGNGKNNNNQSIELASDIIDQAQIAGINLGSTKIIINDKDKLDKAPFVLNNVTFKVSKMLKITEGTTLTNLVNNAQWQFYSDGFSYNSANNLYNISVGKLNIDNALSIVKINNFLLKPLLSEEQFVKQSKFQNDQYNLSVNNIILTEVDINQFINNKILQIKNASFQPIIKIFNDRTLPPDASSKIGKYPHQALLNLKLPIYINKAAITNGYVSYREKALKSKLTGNVLFTNINATINNITNMRERIKANAVMKLNATTQFLNAGKLTTEWLLPLNTGNGAFTVSGRLAGMDAMALNAIIEPLAMASVKQGYIDEVKFAINGENTKTNANVLFMYRNLRLHILEMGNEDVLKKKRLLTILANTVVKNDNTNSSNSKNVYYQRDITKSFFNLVWKTVFTGAKNTVIGKTDKEQNIK